MSEIVALLGKLVPARRLIEGIAKKYGWSVQVAETLSEFQSLSSAEIVAVLFDPTDLHEDQRIALNMVTQIAPQALPIVCCRFSEKVHWLDVTESDVFHLLRYPFARNEVRQTFGFVAEAQRRRRSFQASTELVLERSPGIKSAPMVPNEDLQNSPQDARTTSRCPCCGAETKVFHCTIPVCINCAEMHGVNLPAAERNIHAALRRTLETATSGVAAASRAFNALMSDIPSGLPYPERTHRIEVASRELSVARRAMMTAHSQLDEFLIHGKIPDQF
jgi:hypothetical protein